MKPTKEKLEKLYEAAAEARKRVSAMTPEQRAELEKRARKAIKSSRK